MLLGVAICVLAKSELRSDEQFVSTVIIKRAWLDLAVEVIAK